MERTNMVQVLVSVPYLFGEYLQEYWRLSMVDAGMPLQAQTAKEHTRTYH